MTHEVPEILDAWASLDVDLEPSVVYGALADARRRFVVACLDAYDPPMALSDVADELAVWERDARITDLSAEDVRDVYLALYHHHVPKLADAGIVQYSQERDAVAFTEAGRKIVPLVEDIEIR